MFTEIANNFHQILTDFRPLAPITDRQSWNSIDQEWRKKTVALGETYLDYQFPYIYATDFMDFLRTGNRIRFEDKSFSKRHGLNALILAECVENKGRFLDNIINGIFSICDENAWQLPPHNSYVRDTPQLPLPDVTAPVLDLFACETGAILATAYYLLGSCFDEVSLFIKKRILHELEHRIFIPYLNSHFWWMGNGKEPMNNWTIWCTQNILLAAFLTAQKEDVRRQIFLKAAKSIDYFLDEYGEDGCCDEGALYYRHAGLCLFNTMEILNAITEDAFGSLYQTKKIQNIATYILNVHIKDKYYVNFSDCSPVAGRAGVREFLFAKRIGSENMARFAASDFMAGLPDSLLLTPENNLYYRLQNAFTISEIKKYDRSLPILHPDIYYPSAGVFVARDNHFSLAVKAGDNADSHNHNDTGSFTIYKDGQPLFIDVGVENYTRKTFSPQRYEIWTMQSAYHNLPTISGRMQLDGEHYRAKDIAWQINESVCEIKMDIAGAYPIECNLLFYRRRVKLEKENHILIEDEFAFKPDDVSTDSKQVVLNLMTYEKPIIEQTSPNKTTLSVGTAGTLTIEGGTILQIESIPITDSRLMTAWKHEVYRTAVQAEDNKIKMIIG